MLEDYFAARTSAAVKIKLLKCTGKFAGLGGR